MTSLALGQVNGFARLNRMLFPIIYGCRSVAEEPVKTYTVQGSSDGTKT